MAINLYWHRGAGRSDPNQRNFGDYLSPLIVEAVSGKSVSYAPLKTADMMAIGTILANERKAKRFGIKRRLHVWGAGCGQPGELFSGRHYYHAVRGIETIKRIEGLSSKLECGDPGLLSSVFFEGAIKKKYKVGFVPHYVDHGSEVARRFALESGVHYISVFDDPLEVLKQISSCEFIISSSLHGLVVADSYGVPNVRVRLSSGFIDELKFVDYYSAFGMLPPEALSADNLLMSLIDFDGLGNSYSRSQLSDIQAGLIRCFPAL